MSDSKIHSRWASIILILITSMAGVSIADEDEGDKGKPVMISRDLYGITVTYNNKQIEIHRNQDRTNLIDDFYKSTGKGKITPMHPFGSAPVETIAELELLDALQKKETGDDSIMVVDARVSAGFYRGTIPGSVNISFRDLGKKDLLPSLLKDQFGAQKTKDGWDFSKAKTLLLFCNGAWCRQSITAINRLLRSGYPAEKLKYYRGGMQSWHSFGLTVVVPSDSRS